MFKEFVQDICIHLFMMKNHPQYELEFNAIERGLIERVYSILTEYAAK